LNTTNLQQQKSMDSIVTIHMCQSITVNVCVCVSLLVLQPQCAGEVIQVSVGFFTLQTARQRNQILQSLKGSRDRETLK